jgi:cytochrome c-type biogenesis protein CcmE
MSLRARAAWRFGARRARASRRSAGLLLSLLAFDVAFLVWIFSSDPTLLYAVDVRELVERRAELEEYDLIRVRGLLVPGSLGKSRSRCEYQFRLRSVHDAAASLFVRYRPRAVEDSGCPAPETFCEVPGRDREVSVEGRLDGAAARLVATEIVVKAGKYEFRGDGAEALPCAPVPWVR